jgi:hypothetical protein
MNMITPVKLSGHSRSKTMEEVKLGDVRAAAAGRAALRHCALTRSTLAQAASLRLRLLQMARVSLQCVASPSMYLRYKITQNCHMTTEAMGSKPTTRDLTEATFKVRRGARRHAVGERARLTRRQPRSQVIPGLANSEATVSLRCTSKKRSSFLMRCAPAGLPSAHLSFTHARACAAITARAPGCAWRKSRAVCTGSVTRRGAPSLPPRWRRTSA